VASDLENPGAEAPPLAIVLESPDRARHLAEHVLHEIVDLAGGHAPPQTKAEKERSLEPHELAPGRIVFRIPELLEERYIGVRPEWHGI